MNESESMIEMVYNPTEKDTPLVSFTFHKVRIGFMLFLVKMSKNDQYRSQNHVASVKLYRLLNLTKKMKDSFILLRISKWKKKILHYQKHKTEFMFYFIINKKCPWLLNFLLAPTASRILIKLTYMYLLKAIKCKYVALNYLNHLVLFQISLEMHSLFRLIHMVPNLNQGLKKQSWRLA